MGIIVVCILNHSIFKTDSNNDFKLWAMKEINWISTLSSLYNFFFAISFCCGSVCPYELHFIYLSDFFLDFFQICVVDFLFEKYDIFRIDLVSLQIILYRCEYWYNVDFFLFSFLITYNIKVWMTAQKRLFVSIQISLDMIWSFMQIKIKILSIQKLFSIYNCYVSFIIYILFLFHCSVVIIFRKLSKLYMSGWFSYFSYDDI